MYPITASAKIWIPNTGCPSSGDGYFFYFNVFSDTGARLPSISFRLGSNHSGILRLFPG